MPYAEASKDQLVRRRFFVLHNPTAGFRLRRRLEQVIRLLRERGSLVDVRHTNHETENGPLVEAAIHDGGFDAVVAAGGDGTIRSAASPLLGSEMPLGLIPIGTGNVLAHEIGLRPDAEAIADCLLQGRVVSVPTAFANGRPFLLMVGIGFDGRVINRLDVALRRRIGKLAFVWPVIRSLLAGPDSLRVHIDGSQVAAGWVVLTAVRHYAGAFVIAPAARLEEPGLQVVLFNCKSRLSMLAHLFALGLGRIDRQRDVQHISATTVEIGSAAAVPAQIDGDPCGMTPVLVTASGPSLQLIVPPSSDIRWQEIKRSDNQRTEGRRNTDVEKT
jgi:diacylglycerol kinase (ATP)